MIVYLLTNTVTGSKYVGVTSRTSAKRFQVHCERARKGARNILQCAIRKYGEAVFTIEDIDQAETWQEVHELEKHHIARLGTLAPGGYNMTPGGDGVSGIKHTPEAVARMTLATQAAWDKVTPEERIRRGALISAAKRASGRYTITDKVREAKANAKGRPRSKEFKAKVSEGMKRMVAGLPEGEMARRSKCQKPGPRGPRIMTDEERARRVESARRGAAKRFADPEQRRLVAERTRQQHARRKAKETLVDVELAPEDKQ